MALKAKAVKATASVEESKPVAEQQVAAAEPEVVKAPVAEAPKERALVMVYNLKNAYFQQPSTGLRVNAKETKRLANDSWLDLQVRAGLLALVK